MDSDRQSGLGLAGTLCCGRVSDPTPLCSVLGGDEGTRGRPSPVCLSSLGLCQLLRPARGPGTALPTPGARCQDAL